MKKSRILALGLVLAVLVTGVMAGCSAKKTTTTENDKNITLRTLRWAGAHADYQAQLLGDYAKSKGIKVQQDAIDYGQLFQKIQLNMASGTAQYDLVWAQEIWMPSFIKSNYFKPLDDYIAAKVVPGFDASIYNQNMLKIAEDSAGKIYGLPTYLQTPLLAYNKDMFASAGITVPTDWTWQNTLDVAKQFKAKGTGIAMPAKQGDPAAVDVFIAMARSNGADYFDKNGKLNLTSDAFIAAGDYWGQLAKYSMEGSTTWHYDEVNKALQYGQAPFGLTASGICGALEDKANSSVAGKIGYAPLPYSQQVYGTMATWNWCVSANSAHPKAAFELAAWLTSQDTEKKQTIHNGQISAITSLFTDATLVSQDPWLPAVGKALENANTEPLVDNSTQLITAMEADLSAIATGQSTAKDAFTATQNQLASQFNK
jgi:ABC-type glycerol-3-phosphate transport system substrate-binding protein